jgi:hypothetical protein
MALPSIVFQEGQGGLGRPLANNDHISALCFLNVTTVPSGFATTSVATRCKALYSTDDAIAAGIVKDYSDATAAVGIYTISNAGATGDIITLTVADIAEATGAAQTTSLGAYTRLSTDTTVTLLAASYVALINAGTGTHGYTATSSVGAITITAHKRLGAYLNSLTSLVATITGTIAGTVTQQFGTGSGGATAGVASKMAQYYYQVSEFFRIQPKGKLWVGFFGSPTGTFSEVTDMQNNALGEIRQIGVYKDGTWASGDITLIDTVCATNKALYQPIQALYAGNTQATTDITTMADVGALTANDVMNVLGQCGAGKGNFLYLTNGTAGKKSITCVGAQLGAVSLRKVSESIAWVEETNMSDGVQLETPAFSNGQLVTALSNNALEALNTKRHTFLKKFTGYSGTYFNDSHMCIAQSSDYAYMENNRVISKAERLLYAAYVPKLNSPIQFNSDGTLADITIASLENVGNAALDQMVKDLEVSAKSVTISPTQDVLATSILIIAVVLVINGVARTIQIPIGFKPSIA